MQQGIIYIEEAIKNHCKTLEIQKKFPHFEVVYIQKYPEIFNRKNQSFRWQKTYGKAFILAEKKKDFVMKNPDYCPSDSEESFYFSPLLNCPFDCEYCFLQGMYRSAFPLIFINTDNFKQEIQKTVEAHPQKKLSFFSAYDSDGLALDNITYFTQEFIPWFEQFENASLEIRTKSANIENLKKLTPTKNTLIAFTLTPNIVQQEWEKGTATLAQRIQAIQVLQNLGWKIGIRLDPLFALPEWEKVYREFFQILESSLDFSKVENIYFGFFRLPKEFLKKMKKMYPQSKLFHNYYEAGEHGEMSYPIEKQKVIQDFIYEQSSQLIGEEKVFY